MIQGRCSNCEKNTLFKEIEKNKYKCLSCGELRNRCKNCKGMCKGVICSKCINLGARKGGAYIGGAIFGVFVLGAKIILKKK